MCPLKTRLLRKCRVGRISHGSVPPGTINPKAIIINRGANPNLCNDPKMLDIFSGSNPIASLKPSSGTKGTRLKEAINRFQIIIDPIVYGIISLGCP